jgi:putative zinc finger/helix-turn-helix protein, YgiT family
VAQEVKQSEVMIMKEKAKGRERTTACLECGGPMKVSQRAHLYRFEGGLAVTVEKATVMTCSNCGAESVAIRAPLRLHRAVAAVVVRKPSRLAPAEVAFLRHHLDMTGEKLARHLGVSKTSVSRWETGREPIGQVPDRLLRTLVILHDWDGGHDRPDIGLFASLVPGNKPSRIRATMTGDDWRVAA